MEILQDCDQHGKIKELEKRIINSGTVCFFGLKKQLVNMNRFVKFETDNFISQISLNKVSLGMRKTLDVLFVSKARSKTLEENLFEKLNNIMSEPWTDTSLKTFKMVISEIYSPVKSPTRRNPFVHINDEKNNQSLCQTFINLALLDKFIFTLYNNYSQMD